MASRGFGLKDDLGGGRGGLPGLPGLSRPPTLGSSRPGLSSLGGSGGNRDLLGGSSRGLPASSVRARTTKEAYTPTETSITLSRA